MHSRKQNTLFLAFFVAAALIASGCGSESVEVSKSDPNYKGAVLFAERCAGCHTLTAAGAQGSNPTNEINAKDRTNGPNLDQRHVSRADALAAIRGGGFSGAIMPGNIVTGDDAQAVADFLDEYSGSSQ